MKAIISSVYTLFLLSSCTSVSVAGKCFTNPQYPEFKVKVLTQYSDTYDIVVMEPEYLGAYFGTRRVNSDKFNYYFKETLCQE